MIPVFIATKDTPLFTLLAICSLFDYNRDIPLKVYIGSTSDEIPLKQKFGKCIFNTKPVEFIKVPGVGHGHILNYLYDNYSIADHFVTMDSDIVFLGPGVLSFMYEMLTPECCAISTEICHKLFSPPSHDWELVNGTHCKGPSEYQRRICPFLAMWNNNSLFKRAFKAFGFCNAYQEKTPTNMLFDVAGVLSTVLCDICGERAILFETDKIKHYGAGTWMNLESHFKQELEERLTKYT